MLYFSTYWIRTVSNSQNEPERLRHFISASALLSYLLTNLSEHLSPLNSTTLPLERLHMISYYVMKLLCR